MVKPCGRIFRASSSRKPQRLIERHRRRNDALDANRVELLELLQLARFRRRLQAGERRQRNELDRCEPVM